MSLGIELSHVKTKQLALKHIKNFPEFLDQSFLESSFVVISVWGSLNKEENKTY